MNNRLQGTGEYDRSLNERQVSFKTIPENETNSKLIMQPPAQDPN